MKPTLLNLFATTPKGLELLLVDELKSLGAVVAREKLAGVEFTGDIELAYKACLWSRLANRILLQLVSFPATTPEELYDGVKRIAWDEHMNASSTLAVNFISTQSQITHTLFGAQKVKDAIVDQFREKYNERPNVSREQPDVGIHVYLYRDVANISIDLSGESLHKRAYRLGGGGAAPLKENLAAAILIRAGWPAIAKEAGMLIDPMCGSGTLLIEAAMMAGDIAPGLLRDYFGFLHWKKHQQSVWEKIQNDAISRRETNSNRIPEIIGFDQDPYAIKIAFENIERAQLRGKIHVEKKALSVLEPKQYTKPGLVITNPPYGERLGEIDELQELYSTLGEKLKVNFPNWKAAVFTGNPDLGKVMGVRAKKYYALFNGALPCKLLLFDLVPEKFIDRSPEANNARRIRAAQKAVEGNDMDTVQMFANRLKKNLKHLKKEAERKDISSYRIYDADLPEYPFAIDLSDDTALVQEYEPPCTINYDRALRRQQEVLAILPSILNLPPEKIYFQIISVTSK